MAKDIYDFIVAVLEQLHGWISGGLLALSVELLDRIWDWKIPRKPWIAIFIVGGLIVSVFAAWREEHRKILTQLAYVKIVIEDVPWIPSAGPFRPNERGSLNFGKQNPTTYPATEEVSIQELVFRPAPFPLVNLGPDRNISSPEMEKSVWEELLKDQEAAPHPSTTLDPGETKFSTAYTKVPLTQAQFDRLEVTKTQMMYLIGFDQWKDGDGIHGKTFCYWIHPQDTGLGVAEKCESHNDFIDDATNYVKFLKPPS